MSDRWDYPWKKDVMEQEWYETAKDAARREKQDDTIEAIEHDVMLLFAGFPKDQEKVYALLRRQAAIYDRERHDDAEQTNALLNKRVDELTAMRSSWARRLSHAESECERYRRALGKAKDMAHEIGRL